MRTSSDNRQILFHLFDLYFNFIFWPMSHLITWRRLGLGRRPRHIGLAFSKRSCRPSLCRDYGSNFFSHQIHPNEMVYQLWTPPHTHTHTHFPYSRTGEATSDNFYNFLRGETDLNFFTLWLSFFIHYTTVVLCFITFSKTPVVTHSFLQFNNKIGKFKSTICQDQGSGTKHCLHSTLRLNTLQFN